MRELKFRVWGIDVNGDGEKKMYFIDDIRDTEEAYKTFSHLEDEDIADLNPWMQYTGLKDKNGVEIYEGDVIRMDDGEEYYDYIVGWHNNGYHYIDVRDKVTDCNLIEPDDLYECEVIGNKYENPELLKETV